jgi:hypothetical protein
VRVLVGSCRNDAVKVTGVTKFGLLVVAALLAWLLARRLLAPAQHHPRRERRKPVGQLPARRSTVRGTPATLKFGGWVMPPMRLDRVDGFFERGFGIDLGWRRRWAPEHERQDDDQHR